MPRLSTKIIITPMMNINTNDEKDEKVKDKKAYIIYPHWLALFSILGGVLVIIIGVFVRFILGLSSSSDQVFAVNALIAGILVELGFRFWLKRPLVLAPKIEIPFYFIWPLICLYIFLARPFE